MNTENDNKPTTPAEEDSQGHCALATGSAPAFPDFLHRFRIGNMAECLRLHTTTIRRLIKKRDAQSAIDQIKVLESDAAELRIELSKWESFRLRMSDHEARGSGASKTGIQQPLPARQDNPAHASILPNGRDEGRR